MGIDTCDFEEVRGMCWLRQTVYVLLAGTAFVAFLSPLQSRLFELSKVLGWQTLTDAQPMRRSP